MDTVKLLNYMENIRYDRKMTQEVYLNEVISQRQYYRYRNGESEIPFEVIIKFANKLQIPLLKLISSYQNHAKQELDLINDFMTLILNKQLKEARIKMIKLKNSLLIDDEAIIFYKIGTTLYMFFSNQITNLEMIEILKEQSDFNNIMKKEMLLDSEIYLLGVIMEYSSQDRESILIKIQSLRRNNKILLGGHIIFNAQVFFWIIKNLGRCEKFKDLIEFSDEAIRYNKKNYSYYSMEYFYYYKALAYLRLDNIPQFEENLKESILYLLHLPEHKRQHFIETIKRDTEIDSIEFIIKRIKSDF